MRSRRRRARGTDLALAPRAALAAALVAFLGVAGVGPVEASPTQRRRSRQDAERLARWASHARRLGLYGVVLPRTQRGHPGEVPLGWTRAAGRVLAVRSAAPPARELRPPSQDRVLYHKPYGPRGPDQIPLRGQDLMMAWVRAGGAAVSSFSTAELFDVVLDEPVPLGDVLLALGVVIAGPDAELRGDHGVLHRARLRGGVRQWVRAKDLEGAAREAWRLRPDRRPASELLVKDAARAGFDLLVDEPLAATSVWAGGRATPGAFLAATVQSLPATFARVGEVVAVGADLPLLGLLDPIGQPGTPWTRSGWVEARHLLPAGMRPWAPRRLWVNLVDARRDHVRAAAAWLARARR